MKKSEDEKEKHERLLLYMRGWSHGAAMRVMDVHLEGNVLYEQAYRDGRDARVLAGVGYAESIGYDARMSAICRQDE